MKIAIMQPYLFPYIGYFQLINCVDTYVILDDVSYIKGGWMNRNRIILNNKPFLLTLPVSQASQNKQIKQLELFNKQDAGEKILKTIDRAYINAPEYNSIMPLIREVFNYEENNLSRFIEFSISRLSDYLDIKTKFIRSSTLKKNINKGQDRIIGICKLLNAKVYINPVGGEKLYDKHEFKKEGIQMFFLKTNQIQYDQGLIEFIPNLSIIDVLMFNPQNKVKTFLYEFQLYCQCTN